MMQTRIPRRGLANTAIGLVILGVLAIFGGLLFVRTGANQEASGRDDGETWAARIGSFEISVPASGELVASSQVEISSQLEVRATITSIVDEGSFVRKGDLLISLDDEDIRNRISQEKLAVDNAEASLSSAQSALEVRQLTGESAMSLAEVDIRLARTALESWREGEDKAKTKQLSLDLQTTMKDHERLTERFEASKLLLAEKFISEDEFSRDEIELLRSSSRVEQAQLALKTYDLYDREMQLERLTADIQRAEDKARETRERYQREVEAQEREVANKEFQLEDRRKELAKAERQLGMTQITAPQDGLVVYASTLQSSMRNREDPPDIGTELRRNRPVIILPDTTRMAASVKVNEALAGRIRPGQRVVVTADALPNVPIEGRVLSVGVLAEGGGWRDPNRRDYSVRVELETNAELGLKPSMRCKSRIEVGRVEDALHVPIQAVARQGRLAFVWVAGPDGYEARPVKLGRASELMIEVRSGLEDGEPVLLRDPTADEIAVSIEAATEAMGGDEGPEGQGRPA